MTIYLTRRGEREERGERGKENEGRGRKYTKAEK